MKKHSFIAIAFVSLACSTAAAFPAARSAFDFMNIRFGGVSSSLGGAGVAAAGSLEGVFLNPASLASQRGGVAVLGSFNPYLDMSLWSAAASVTVEKKFSVAVAACGLSYGNLAGDISWNGDPGRLLTSGDLTISLSAAVPLAGYLKLPFALDLGMSAKVATQSLDELDLNGLLFDAGALAGFRTGRGVLTLGLQARSIGTVLDAKDRLSLPTALAAGVAWRMTVAEALSLKFLADGEYDPAAAGWRGAFGAEAGLFSLAFVRCGYALGHETGLSRGLTLGMGARVRISTVQVRVDYAFSPLGDLGGIQHNVQLAFAFEPLPTAR